MTASGEAVLAVLTEYVGALIARSMLSGAASAIGIDAGTATASEMLLLAPALEAAAHTFISDRPRAEECVGRLHAALFSAETGGTSAPVAVVPSFTQVDILSEYDVVNARSRAKSLCDDAGFPPGEQVKVATVVSELARNIFAYVGSGRIEFELVDAPRRGIEIRAIDSGPGIAAIDAVLAGRYRSKTGMGVGLRGTRKVMDEFAVDTGPGRGTRIVTRKYVA